MSLDEKDQAEFERLQRIFGNYPSYHIDADSSPRRIYGVTVDEHARAEDLERRRKGEVFFHEPGLRLTLLDGSFEDYCRYTELQGRRMNS
jgi:hypothetical protein